MTDRRCEREMNLVHSAAEVFRLLFEPSVHSSPSCFIHSFLDHKHRQHGTRERKEFHFQSVFQVLRLVLGITPKAVLFQPLKQPNEMGRDFNTGLRKLRLGEGKAPRAESLGFHSKALALSATATVCLWNACEGHSGRDAFGSRRL